MKLTAKLVLDHNISYEFKRCCFAQRHHPNYQIKQMNNAEFLDQELTLNDLEMINGSGLAGWVFWAWRKWITDESDDVVNALDELNEYAKNRHASMEEGWLTNYPLSFYLQ